MNKLMWKITNLEGYAFYKSLNTPEVNRYLDKGYKVKRVW